MSEEIKDLIRPVKCYFCDQRMFYSNQEGWEPEMHVNISRSLPSDEDRPLGFYCHVSCWNERIEGKKL